MFMKAMKGIIKWIALIAGGTLCLAVVLTTVAYALIGTDFGARQISKVVSQMINGEANIKHVNLTLISSYPMVTVEIDGLSLKSDVLQKKEHLASADTLRATMDLGLFLDKDDIRVTEAYLVNPDFNGHVRSDGKGNFEVYESEDTTQTPMPKVWVEHLQIKDGTVRWTDEQSAMKVFSEHLNLNLKDVEYTDRIRADVVMNARKLVYEDLSSKMCAVADTTSMNVSFLMKESMIAKGSLASQGVAFRDTTMSMRPQPLHVDIDLHRPIRR